MPLSLVVDHRRWLTESAEGEAKRRNVNQGSEGNRPYTPRNEHNDSPHWCPPILQGDTSKHAIQVAGTPSAQNLQQTQSVSPQHCPPSFGTRTRQKRAACNSINQARSKTFRKQNRQKHNLIPHIIIAPNHCWEHESGGRKQASKASKACTGDQDKKIHRTYTARNNHNYAPPRPPLSFTSPYRQNTNDLDDVHVHSFMRLMCGQLARVYLVASFRS